MDVRALARGPVFDLLGIEAEYTPPTTGMAKTIRVLDHTEGEEVEEGAGIYTVLPTVHAKPDDLDDPPEGGAIAIHGQTYTIRSHGWVRGVGGSIRLILSRL